MKKKTVIWIVIAIIIVLTIFILLFLLMGNTNLLSSLDSGSSSSAWGDSR